MHDESSHITSAGLPNLKLDQLVERITLKHGAVIAHLRSALADAHETGQLLIEAQRRIPYGSWTSWVEQKLPFSVRTANNYIRIARAWPRLPDTVGSIEGALEFLAQPRPALPTQALVELPPAPETLTAETARPRLRALEDRLNTIDSDEWSVRDLEEVAALWERAVAAIPQVYDVVSKDGARWWLYFTVVLCCELEDKAQAFDWATEPRAAIVYQRLGRARAALAARERAA